MSNHNQNGQQDRKNNGPKLNEKEQEIFDHAKRFAELSRKKYCKRAMKDLDFTKKEAKAAYYDDVFNYHTLEDALYFALRWGHHSANRQTLEGIYEKISDPEFVEELAKRIKHARKRDDEGSAEFFESIRFMPVVLHNLIREINAQNTKLQEEGEPLLKTDDLEVIRDELNKPRAKKLIKKDDCDERVAYSILSVYPVPECARFSPAFYINRMMSVIYRAAADDGVKIPVDAIFKRVVGKDYYPNLVLYLLLEKKVVTQNFSNQQFAVYNRISEWVLKTLNKMEPKDIMKILRTYVNRRHEDAKQNKDSNRRMYLRSTVQQATYPTLHECISDMMEEYNDKVAANENYQGPNLKKIL